VTGAGHLLRNEKPGCERRVSRKFAAWFVLIGRAC
jgi:hypothetical protein